MKIIALEEHTTDRAIGAATAKQTSNLPYFNTFTNANMPASTRRSSPTAMLRSCCISEFCEID